MVKRVLTTIAQLDLRYCARVQGGTMSRREDCRMVQRVDLRFCSNVHYNIMVAHLSIPFGGSTRSKFQVFRKETRRRENRGRRIGDTVHANQMNLVRGSVNRSRRAAVRCDAWLAAGSLNPTKNTSRANSTTLRQGSTPSHNLARQCPHSTSIVPTLASSPYCGPSVAC